MIRTAQHNDMYAVISETHKQNNKLGLCQPAYSGLITSRRPTWAAAVLGLLCLCGALVDTKKIVKPCKLKCLRLEGQLQAQSDFWKDRRGCKQVQAMQTCRAIADGRQQVPPSNMECMHYSRIVMHHCRVLP